jgi:hypothetical protein
LNNSDSIGLFAGQKVLKEFQVSGESCSDHREVKIYVYLCCQEEELEAFEIPVASVVVAACDRFRAFSENLVSRVEFGDCATQRNDSVLPHRLTKSLKRWSFGLAVWSFQSPGYQATCWMEFLECSRRSF